MITAKFDDVRRLLREQGEAQGMSVETPHDRDRFFILLSWLKSNVGGTLLLSGTFREIEPDRRTFTAPDYDPLIVEGLSADREKVLVTDSLGNTFTIQPTLHGCINFYLRR